MNRGDVVIVPFPFMSPRSARQLDAFDNPAEAACREGKSVCSEKSRLPCGSRTVTIMRERSRL